MHRLTREINASLSPLLAQCKYRATLSAREASFTLHTQSKELLERLEIFFEPWLFRSNSTTRDDISVIAVPEPPPSLLSELLTKQAMSQMIVEGIDRTVQIDRVVALPFTILRHGTNQQIILVDQFSNRIFVFSENPELLFIGVGANIRDLMYKRLQVHAWQPFHAAAVDTPRGAILLCGKKGAGKTSLALRLILTEGFDCKLIDNDRPFIQPSPHGTLMIRMGLPLIRITPDTLQLFPELSQRLGNLGSQLLVNSSGKIAPAGRQVVELTGTPFTAQRDLAAVVFVELDLGIDEPKVNKIDDSYPLGSLHDSFGDPWPNWVGLVQVDQQMVKEQRAAYGRWLSSVPLWQLRQGRNGTASALAILQEVLGGS